MSNNLSLPALGTVIATENIGGVHYQYFILANTSGSEIGGTALPIQVGGTVVDSAGTIQFLAGTVNVAAGSSVITAGTVTQVQSSYISGTTTACGAGTTEILAPATSNYAVITSEDAAIYYVINGIASSTSPGYIPSYREVMLPVISNLGTISVTGAGTAAVAHVSFYKE